MEVDVKNREGVIVLKPRGRLIGPASSVLKQAIETQLKDVAESPNFLFDFADCQRMDSASVGVLLGLHVSIRKFIMQQSKMIVLIFVVMLLIYGIQGTSSGDDAVELVGQLDCSENEHLFGAHYRITVSGTIRAVRAVSFLTVTAYINGEWLGVDLIGELSAGSTASFSIAGLHTATRDAYSCYVEADWQELVKPDDDRSDDDQTDDEPSSESQDFCSVGDILSPGESCIDPGTGDTFSVLADGRGQYLSITTGTGITLRGSINGKDRNFVARNRGDGTWEIESVTSSSPPPPVEESDLIVEPPTVSKSRLVPGENFILSATVKNKGAGNAPSTTLRYYRSTDSTISTSDTEVGTDSISSLRANRSGDEGITLTAPTSPGTYYYGACVDSVTDESNSNNNCSGSVGITVELPNLILSVSTTSPLTEANLDGSVVTLTLSGGTFRPPVNGIIGGQTVSDSVLGVEVSGILGVTIPSESVPANVIINGVQQLGIRYAIDRISDTELEVKLAFDGTNFDTDAALTFTVEAAAIENYDGSALTAEVPVTAIKGFDFDLSVPAGTSLVHVSLNVTKVDGVDQTIESISDLYDALGGASTVNYLITYNSQTQAWLSYFSSSDSGTLADRSLTDDMGILVGMKTPVSVRLGGDALGTGDSGTISLNQGLNVVGVPLRDSRITRVSDLLSLDGIRNNVPVIIHTDDGEFKVVGRVGDPGDIPITGGQGFIMTAQQAATVTISGEAWSNVTDAAAPLARKGIEVGDTISVLALRGTVVDERTGAHGAGFRVSVKNLSTGSMIAGMIQEAGRGYQFTVVDIETGKAASIGDSLEITAQTPDPLIGVHPLRYTVTAEDVRRSLIQLPELVAYEIPAETQLLANYPNPFNPETWIPYRLAADAFVTLTIYDRTGKVVRAIDVGYRTAAVYESRTKAIYWDGRNEFGETVASGVYFYHLSASRFGLSAHHRSDFSATRKMLIIK